MLESFSIAKSPTKAYVSLQLRLQMGSEATQTCTHTHMHTHTCTPSERLISDELLLASISSAKKRLTFEHLHHLKERKISLPDSFLLPPK